ncbi:MAG: cysteine hydrolase family protein [Pseudorhodoplanes sp.]
MPRLPADTVLMIVDLQKAIDDSAWGPRNNPDAEERIAGLLAGWRAARMPVVHVRHDSPEALSPYRPGGAGHAFKAQAMPVAGETIVGKSARSAFIGTDLEERLGGATTLVICGVLTHHSVEATVRHAGDLGYRVFVPADACWAIDVRDSAGRLWPAEDVHQLSLAVMDGEYARITNSMAVLDAVALARSRRQR